jgi:hypothetical protein
MVSTASKIAGHNLEEVLNTLKTEQEGVCSFLPIFIFLSLLPFKLNNSFF